MILTFVLIVAVQALFYNLQNERATRADQGMPRSLSRLRSAQLEALGAYGWIDRGQGVVAVPIERAMELIVQEAARAGASPPSNREVEQ